MSPTDTTTAAEKQTGAGAAATNSREQRLLKLRALQYSSSLDPAGVGGSIEAGSGDTLAALAETIRSEAQEEANIAARFLSADTPQSRPWLPDNSPPPTPNSNQHPDNAPDRPKSCAAFSLACPVRCRRCQLCCALREKKVVDVYVLMAGCAGAAGLTDKVAASAAVVGGQSQCPVKSSRGHQDSERREEGIPRE